MTRTEKLKLAVEKDDSVVCDRDKVNETLGNNPDYLFDVHNITKSDLIRWERQGLAFKARYETRHPKQDLWDALNKVRLEEGLKPIVGKTGTHRIRWLIFKEALNDKV